MEKGLLANRAAVAQSMLAQVTNGGGQISLATAGMAVMQGNLPSSMASAAGCEPAKAAKDKKKGKDKKKDKKKEKKKDKKKVKKKDKKEEKKKKEKKKKKKKSSSSSDSSSSSSSS